MNMPGFILQDMFGLNQRMSIVQSLTLNNLQTVRKHDLFNAVLKE